ncbi:type VI secretion system ATPase TssH [Commensalibacter nepenthis]|uniref:Type VI secretion system ATPase TssH n=1 Tax=Commensalibacter nepenthis TaxID=3043872 RepID=A0ABT6Q4C5_9PROT|nr:type VI secretion system ATPase TssH [Commensalibacter sp. TBRC 10068]MDI2111739.1 type VI secretion system ATPase TssH [Commensalibacter sp. TBRC 10068]
MDNSTASLLRRLNPYCAKALEAAASLCQTRAHAEITIEHWLLKLLEEGEGDITVIARRYEWDLEELWRNLLSYLDGLSHSIQTRPQLSKEFISLLQASWLIASLEENTESIRSCHILQALMNQPEWLRASGTWPLLSLRAIQLQRLRPLLDEHSDERDEIQNKAALNSVSSPTETLEKTKKTTSKTKTSEDDAYQQILDKFTTDVTRNAKEGKIDPIFGRDNEIRQMVDILTRRRKNNPILVGEPGVGKTALVEGLALRIAEGNVPTALKNVSLRTLDIGLLQAGAGVKGEFEQRLKNIIEAVQRSSNPVLLFIDEAHTIIGAGNQAGGSDAANLLKPALARGELRTIAATTWSEYKQYFEKDAALERRFQIVKVDEPNDEQACLMLRGLKEHYMKYHNVHIQDPAVKAAVTLSRRYLTGRQLPDKAVDLLDTASARVRMSLDTLPEIIVQIKAKIAAYDLEYKAIENDFQFSSETCHERLGEINQQKRLLQDQLKDLISQFEKEKETIQKIINLRQKKITHESKKQEIFSLQGESINGDKKSTEDQNIIEQKIQSLMQEMSETNTDKQEIIHLQQKLITVQNDNPLISLDVTEYMVATVIADWTGIPLSSLLKDEQTNLLELEATLGKSIIGQEHALNEIAKKIRAAKTGLTSDKGPLGVFLLVGPSGVGKTETALTLSNMLFAGEKSLITINLSEYQEAHTVSQLKGSPPGYVGYGQGGVLTEAVRKNPYSIVLLDEVEKAHKDVLNLFYQVFDRGFMRDGEGREVDFRNCVILMTSNLGSEHMMTLLDEQPEATISELHELIRPILKNHFQAALLARFQTIIYRPLSAMAMRQIVEIKFKEVIKRLMTHYKIECVIQDSLYDMIVEACLLPDTGARNIDSLLDQQILPILSQNLLQQLADKKKISSVSLEYNDEEGIMMSFNS